MHPGDRPQPAPPRVPAWLASKRLVGAAVIAMGLVLIGTGAHMWWTAERLTDRGQVAEATVAAVVERTKQRSARVIVEFTTADGRDVRAYVGDWDWDGGPREGDVQTVLYDPGDPEGLVADTRVGPHDSERFLFAGIGVLLVVYGVLVAVGRASLFFTRTRQGRPG